MQKIDFIAMAPEGKEVEELTGKEILQALRKKIPAREYNPGDRTRGVKRYDLESNNNYNNSHSNNNNNRCEV